MLGMVLWMGCTRGPDQGGKAKGAPPAVAAVDAAEVARRAATELALVQAAAVSHADSVARRLRSVRPLSRSETSALRRDVNREQIAQARALGIRAGSEEAMGRLAARGNLVQLPDSTDLWVVEKLTQSAPFLTPDADAMLVEIGTRFQTRLDSLGLPRFRLAITSVMRTEDGQADLRRINANASRIVSAHQFGTTLDISHLRFAAPAVPPAGVPRTQLPTSAANRFYAEQLDSVAVRNAAALRAVLGRVLREMKGEGKLLVMMERQQAVYHLTVARRFPDELRKVARKAEAPRGVRLASEGRLSPGESTGED